MEEMASMWYKMHYQQAISPSLTLDQKLSIANKIGQLTLREPIWADRDTDRKGEFPELAPFVNVPLSGLYLCAILDGIVGEFRDSPHGEN